MDCIVWEILIHDRKRAGGQALDICKAGLVIDAFLRVGQPDEEGLFIDSARFGNGINREQSFDFGGEIDALAASSPEERLLAEAVPAQDQLAARKIIKRQRPEPIEVGEAIRAPMPVCFD